MRMNDVSLVIDGVKVTLCEYRKPLKTSRTWKTAVLHTFAYAGVGGRGLRKGRSTKTNRF